MVGSLLKLPTSKYILKYLDKNLPCVQCRSQNSPPYQAIRKRLSHPHSSIYGHAYVSSMQHLARPARRFCPPRFKEPWPNVGVIIVTTARDRTMDSSLCPFCP